MDLGIRRDTALNVYRVGLVSEKYGYFSVLGRGYSQYVDLISTRLNRWSLLPNEGSSLAGFSKVCNWLSRQDFRKRREIFARLDSRASHGKA